MDAGPFHDNVSSDTHRMLGAVLLTLCPTHILATTFLVSRSQRLASTGRPRARIESVEQLIATSFWNKQLLNPRLFYNTRLGVRPEALHSEGCHVDKCLWEAASGPRSRAPMLIPKLSKPTVHELVTATQN